MVSVGGRAAFSVDGPSGSEPWVTDGTTAGTVALGDIRPGPHAQELWALTGAAPSPNPHADERVPLVTRGLRTEVYTIRADTLRARMRVRPR